MSDADRAAYHAAALEVQRLCGDLSGAIGELRAAQSALRTVSPPPGAAFCSRIDGVIVASLGAWRRAEPEVFARGRGAGR